MLAVVIWGSPYAPVVQPCPENIEEIWAIEDARWESEAPIVTVLENCGMPLAYEAATDTFYCTLGLDLEDGWPNIHITAPDAQGVELVFVDDYEYDLCSDAVKDGYSYGILAYTDEAYHYAQIVFTGLPLIVVECDEEIGDIDVPMKVMISADGYEPIVSTGNIHLRGNSSKSSTKKNLKVEFTRSQGGKRNPVVVPEIGLRDDLLLNPMVFDERLVRDKLCWELYGEMLGLKYNGGFGARKTAYAELFLNGEYYGIYLMMEPMEEEKELLKTGASHLLTDSVYRVLPAKYERGRPIFIDPTSEGLSFELRYEPTGSAQFAALASYIELLLEEDDEAFVRKAEACVDIESVVRYVLLLQATALSDNRQNNVYIWARRTEEGMRYQLAPWDMDMSWGKAWGGMDDKFGANLNGWYSFEILDRIIRCNAGGAADLIVKRWREWRKDIFDVNHIGEMVNKYYKQLWESGALMRNDQRWGYETNPEAYAFIDFAEIRFAAMDRAMDAIENRNEVFPAFLENKNSKSKFVLIPDM